MRMPARARRDVIEALTEGEAVFDLLEFWEAIARLTDYRGMTQEDAVVKFIAKLSRRYGTFNLRGVENNMRFRDLGPA